MLAQFLSSGSRKQRYIHISIYLIHVHMFETPRLFLYTQDNTHFTHPGVPEIPEPSPGVCQPHPGLILGTSGRHEWAAAPLSLSYEPDNSLIKSTFTEAACKPFGKWHALSLNQDRFWCSRTVCGKWTCSCGRRHQQSIALHCMMETDLFFYGTSEGKSFWQWLSCYCQVT